MKKFFAFTLISILLSLSSFATSPLPIVGPPGACVGSSALETDSLTGGTWSSSNTAVATVGSTGMVYGMSVGTSYITYTVGGSYVTELFTVSPAPAAISGASGWLCTGATMTLSDATPGGVWTSGYPSVATVGSSSGLVTAVSGPGLADIYYTMGPACYAVKSVTVDPGSWVDSVVGPSMVCTGSTITVSDMTPGGVWSSSNTTVATVSGGVVTGVSAGTAIISYGVTPYCSTIYGTGLVVTVVSSVTAGTVSGAATISAGATTSYTDVGGTPGGTWSSSNPAVATVNPSTGVVTGVSTGTSDISYSVTGCGSTASASSMITVTPANKITGTVNFTGATYTGPVMVWLITYNPSTYMLQAVDSVVVSSSGTSASYEFFGPVTDSYRVKAAVLDTISGAYGYIPTYHSSSFYWYTATVLNHVAPSVDAGQDITMMWGLVVSGPGFIGGNVMSGANRGTTSSIPSVGLQMYCVNATTGKVIQQTKTDASGNYGFSGLATGLSYYVHPEALSYIATDYPTINLTTTSYNVTTASFLQHTKSLTITPVVSDAVISAKPLAASVVTYPNPTNGKLTIQWQEPTAEQATAIITDVMGHEITRSTISMTEGNGFTQVDLSGLSNGLYMISIKSAAINYNNKIEIQK